MQAATIRNRNPTTESFHLGYSTKPRIYNIQFHLYRRLLDFLEYKWGSKVSRVKNSFYSESHPEKPIAWLDSQNTVTIVPTQCFSRDRNLIHTRIEDIELPTPIRLEYGTYQNLLFHLIRSSSGGVVRWLNKIYSARTGAVLAEIISPQKIKLFESQGLFGVSKEVELSGYASIEVQRDQYVHLLNFLEQGTGEEVVRVGNTFYSRGTIEKVRDALKFPQTVEPKIAQLMKVKFLAELVSQETVRLSDGTVKRISDLALTKRVYRTYLYFCNSCQSFIRTTHRTNIHQRLSEMHSILYLSSDLVLLPIPKVDTSSSKEKMEKGDFADSLHRFWGVEDGKVAESRRRGRNSNKNKREEQQPLLLLPLIPKVGAIVLAKLRSSPNNILLNLADITVDDHVVTDEEKILALQRLQVEEVDQETTKEIVN
jgi:hypothetical protein